MAIFVPPTKDQPIPSRVQAKLGTAGLPSPPKVQPRLRIGAAVTAAPRLHPGGSDRVARPFGSAFPDPGRRLSRRGFPELWRPGLLCGKEYYRKWKQLPKGLGCSPAGRVAHNTAGACQRPRGRIIRRSRLQAIRLRYSINTYLEDRAITTPAAIDASTGLPSVEVVRLLTRWQWHEGDVTALKAIADRLGLDVPLEGLDPAVGKGRARWARTWSGRRRPLRSGRRRRANRPCAAPSVTSPAPMPPRPVAFMPATGATSPPGASRLA